MEPTNKMYKRKGIRPGRYFLAAAVLLLSLVWLPSPCRAQKLSDEARDKYYEAQQRYARYMDENQALSRRSFRTEQERLQNEMTLAFNLYNQTAQQLQLARAKVQELTPVYAVVQPATVPLRPSRPSKLLILVGCVFLAGTAAAAWTIFGREFVGTLRGKKEGAQGCKSLN